MGDYVFSKMHPYHFQPLASQTHEKLSQRYYGPVKILEIIVAVAYRLALPPTKKINFVFHVS